MLMVDAGSSDLRSGHGADGSVTRVNGVSGKKGGGSMNRKRKIWFRQAGGVLMPMAFGAAVLAPSLKADDGAPAARAVRLSSVDGKVQFVQGNQVLADEAVANTPLFEGAQVVTGEEGRAEIQFEDGAVARV